MGDPKHMVCTLCKQPVSVKKLNFHDDDLLWTVDVVVCTYAPCLVNRGATSRPRKVLAS